MPRSSRSSRSSISLSLRQRQAFLVLLLPLAWLLFMGWQQLAGALMDYQTQQWFKHWQENAKQKPYRLPDDEFRIASQGAVKAAELQPMNTMYALRAGAVADWFVLYGDKKSPYYGEAKTQALDYYRRVTQLRPVWPEAWFDLAFVKSRQRLLDDEFSEAFIRSIELGPWEKRLQSRAASLTLRRYRSVNPEVKAAMRDNMRRFAVFQPRAFRQLMKKRNGWKRACVLLEAPLPAECGL